MMLCLKYIKLFLLLLLMNACHQGKSKHDFYSYTKRSDLWRVPLLEPYELISTTNSNDWFLILNKPVFKNPDYFDPGGEYQLANIDSVGILHDLILVSCPASYWPKLSGSYRTSVLIDTKNDNKYIYSGQHHQKQLLDKLTELKAAAIRLYPVEQVVGPFQKDMSLPKEWKQKE